MFLVFDWWLDVIGLKSHRNATNCIDFNIVIRILNTPVSAKMAQGQRKWHVVIYILENAKWQYIPWNIHSVLLCFVLLWPYLIIQLWDRHYSDVIMGAIASQITSLTIEAKWHMGKINCYLTTTKYSKVQAVCLFNGLKCIRLTRYSVNTGWWEINIHERY